MSSCIGQNPAFLCRVLFFWFRLLREALDWEGNECNGREHWQSKDIWSETTLNYRIMVERYPNLKEEVDGSNLVVKSLLFMTKNLSDGQLPNVLWRWPVGIQSKKRAKNKVKTFEVVEGIKKVSISPKMKNCTIWCKIETCPKLKNSHLGTPFLVGLIMAPRNLIWATFVAQLNVCVYAHYGVLGDLVSCEKFLSRFHLFCFAIMCVCVYVCCGA